MTLRYLRPANQELKVTARYYEEQQDGLGAEFLGELNTALEHLSDNPLLGSVLYKGYRHIKVRRFPFSVVYNIEPDHILIIAVMHQKRNPHYWYNRV